MADFGGFNPFPFEFGGDPRPIEQEYNALRESLSPNRQGYNVDDDLIDVEIYAHAQALALIWDANARTANQGVPARMLEEVTRWETILRLRPAPTDSVQDRRAAIEAKLRGLAGNAEIDIEGAASAILGSNYVGVTFLSSADATVYWPGVCPGPPGFEWYSNALVARVEMTRKGLSDAQFYALTSRLGDTLDAMLPVWMCFDFYVGDEGLGFFIEISGLDEVDL